MLLLLLRADANIALQCGVRGEQKRAAILTPFLTFNSLKDDQDNMTRRIITLAASALALTFGIAPLTAQADADYNTNSITVSASADNTVNVTNVGNLNFSTFDPNVGVPSQDYSFDVAFNGSGYTAKFASANTSGTDFRMLETGAGKTATIPYTINQAGSGGASYTSGSAGGTLTSVAPDFTFAIPVVSVLTTAPPGAYQDTLTLTVTPV
jgi:spore coat protein U-like protein